MHLTRNCESCNRHITRKKSGDDGDDADTYTAIILPYIYLPCIIDSNFILVIFRPAALSFPANMDDVYDKLSDNVLTVFFESCSVER